MKIFIFGDVIRVIRLVVDVNQRHLNAPVVEEGKAGSSPKSFTGALICRCTLKETKNTHISGVLLINTLKRVNFLPLVNWFRSMRLRLLSRCARRESFIRAFSFFSLCFFKLSTSFFPFSIFSFEYISLNNLKT